MKKILIVEDELILALMIERMIKNMGHKVVAKVASGEEAIQKAIELQPDLILMDIRLQGEIDGIETMAKIQQEVAIPVIYTTGNNDPVHRERLKTTDYIDFIVKPISQLQLLNSFKLVS